MLWSTFVGKDYCVAIARSKSGRVDGEWTHDEKLLFSKEMNDNTDGGHGMIFRDENGKMYLSLHSPNLRTDLLKEQTVFVPLREEGETLVCEL